MSLFIEDVREACANAADHLGVIILSEDHLHHGVLMCWSTVRGCSYRKAIALVERHTTAQEFRALEFAEAVAARLDVRLFAFVPRQQPPAPDPAAFELDLEPPPEPPEDGFEPPPEGDDE